MSKEDSVGWGQEDADSLGLEAAWMRNKQRRKSDEGSVLI